MIAYQQLPYSVGGRGEAKCAGAAEVSNFECTQLIDTCPCGHVFALVTSSLLMFAFLLLETHIFWVVLLLKRVNSNWQVWEDRMQMCSRKPSKRYVVRHRKFALLRRRVLSNIPEHVTVNLRVVLLLLALQSIWTQSNCHLSPSERTFQQFENNWANRSKTPVHFSTRSSLVFRFSSLILKIISFIMTSSRLFSLDVALLRRVLLSSLHPCIPIRNPSCVPLVMMRSIMRLLL